MTPAIKLPADGSLPTLIDEMPILHDFGSQGWFALEGQGEYTAMFEDGDTERNNCIVALFGKNHYLSSELRGDIYIVKDSDDDWDHETGECILDETDQIFIEIVACMKEGRLSKLLLSYF